MRSARWLGGLLVGLSISAAGCGLDRSAPTGVIAYSANPALAGPLVISATFDEPLAAPPAIRIARADGAAATAGRMTGADRDWRFDYLVVPGGGLDVELRAGVLHLYYAATTLTPEFERQIGCALSRGGVSWEKCVSNPVLSPESEAAAFEGNEVEEPALADFYGAWLMAYSGYGGDQGDNFHLGLAYSTDGLEWERLWREPALKWGAPGSFDETGAGQPSLRVEGSELWLWYTGYTLDGSAIGLAVAALE